MADTNRMRIVVEADNKSANQGFAQTTQVMDQMAAQAVKVAQSISQHFQTMANEIRAAINGLNGAFAGMAMPRGLVDQYGRPMASSGGSAPMAPPPIAVAARSFSFSPELIKEDQQLFSKMMQYKVSLLKSNEAFAKAEAAGNPVSRWYNAQMSAYYTNQGAQIQSRIQTEHPELIKKINAMSPDESAALAKQTLETKNLSGATDGVGNSFGGSMIKAVAFFEILQQGSRILKELLIDSTHAAASVQMYGTAMHAVATSSGIPGGKVDALEEQLKNAGDSTAGARKSLIYAMTSDMDLSGMPQLARMAKGMTAMNPDSTPGENLQALVEAISTQMQRGLRRRGVYGIDFTHAIGQYAFEQHRSPESLIQPEKVRAAEKEVQRVAPKYEAMGAGIDPLQQAIQNLAIHADEAKVAIGQGLLPMFSAMITLANMAASFVANNPWAAKLIGVGAATIAGAGAGAIAGSLIPGVGTATVGALGAAVGFTTSAAALLYGRTHQDSQQTKDAKKAAADASAAGNAVTQSASEKLEIANNKKLADNVAIGKLIAASRKATADAADESITKNLEGRYAIEAKAEADKKKYSRYTDPEGVTTQIHLDAQTGRNIDRTRDNEIFNAKKKAIADLGEEATKEYANQFEGEAKIDAALGLRIDGMKKLGWYDDQAVKDALSLLGIFQKQTAVVEEQHKMRDELAQTKINDLQGYAKIDAELEHTISEQKRLGKWSPGAEADARSIAGVQSGALGRQNSDELLQLKRAADKSLEQDQLDSLNAAKEAKLASVEQGYTFDLKSKLSAEQAKYAIEIDFLNQIQAKKKEIRQGDLDDQIHDLGVQKDRGLLNETEYNKDVLEARRRAGNDINKISTDGNLKQQELLKQSTHAQREMLQTEYTQLYDKLKGSVSSVFDSMWDKNRSILDALGESLKNFFKKLASDIISTQVTKGLMGMITGQEVQTVSPGAGVMRGPAGWFSKIIGGATGQPVIGGGAQQESSTSTPSADDVVHYQHGAPTSSAGTGPRIPGSEFAPFSGGFTNAYSDASPVTTGAQANSILYPNGSKNSPLNNVLKSGQKDTKLSFLDNIKKSFWNDTINMGDHSSMTPGDIGGFKGKAAGVLTSQGAADLELAGGTMLATNGLAGNDRGTLSGVLKGGLGGALMGAGIGTMILPGIGTLIGAGVGAAAGALAGIGEMIAGVESPQREAVRLVKQIYGISINNKMGDQIAAIAKSKYGNMISVAVRSPDVRQLLQLYAESTGQKSNLFMNDPHGVNLVQTNAGLQQSAVYHNGVGYTYASSLSTLGNPGQNMPTGNPYAGGPVSVHVSAEETQNLWANGVAQGISGSPRQVASANVNGQTASSSRISANMMSNPDLVAF